MGSSPILPLVDILFALSKAILIIFEKHATHYQTLETWIGHNATRYPIWNVLPHALPYIFSGIFLVLGNLQRVTTRYRQIYKKKIYIYILFFLKKLTVTRGNTLQIAQNQANLRQNVW